MPVMSCGVNEETVRSMPLFETLMLVYTFVDGKREVWISDGLYPTTYQRLVVSGLGIYWLEPGENDSLSSMHEVLEDIRALKLEKKE